MRLNWLPNGNNQLTFVVEKPRDIRRNPCSVFATADEAGNERPNRE